MPDERDAEAGAARQRVVRVPGSRRAQLTPATGTDTSPESAPDALALRGARAAQTPSPRAAPSPKGPKGPNDERMLQDVPPHY